MCTQATNKVWLQSACQWYQDPWKYTEIPKKMQITFEKFLVSCFLGQTPLRSTGMWIKMISLGSRKKKSLTYKKNPSRESGTRIKVVGQDRNKS